jgi:AcrR family transcriptional regulator
MKRAAHTRTRILESSIKTLLTHGVTGLTLDAVAEEANISKGGLLHHFRSKDALVEAILRQLFADFEVLVQHYYEQESDTPGRWLRAYIRASFDDKVDLPLGLVPVLAGAVLENDELLQVIQDDGAMWQQRLVNDGISPPRATVIRQAADAQLVEKLLGPIPETQAQCDAVMDELLRLVDAP